MLLSGDRQETASAIGVGLGISPENTFGDVTPEGKADCISELKKQGRKVAMVGDGINDAAALAEADVGIAMAGGVGAASEVASIVLLGDRPSQVVDALELSNAVRFGAFPNPDTVYRPVRDYLLCAVCPRSTRLNP